MKIRSLVLATMVACAAHASAAYIDYALFDLGTVSYDGWGDASQPSTRLIRANYPAYATSSGGVGTLASYASAWSAPLVSNTIGSGDALFDKLSGSGAFAGSGVYQSGSTGSFTVYDLTALANLETIVFQMEVNYLDTGATFESTVMELVINGVTYTPTNAIWFEQAAGTGVVLGTSDIYAYQWDLRGVTDITSFSISWNGPASSGQITSMQLVQGTTYTQVVPEASTVTCMAAAVGLLSLRRRR